MAMGGNQLEPRHPVKPRPARSTTTSTWLVLSTCLAALAFSSSCEALVGDYVVGTGGTGGSAAASVGCKKGEHHCDRYWLFYCVDGKNWTLADSCDAEYLCDSEVGRCKTCRVGEYRCDGNQLEVCTSEENGWRLSEECNREADCSASERFCGPCAEGFYQCSGAEGRTLQQCHGGEWSTLEDCASATLCGQGLDRWKDDPDSVAQCQEPACSEADAYSCNESQLMRCAPDLSRMVQLDRCAGEEFCERTLSPFGVPDARAGRCIVPACSSPGELRCESAAGPLLRCSNDLSGWQTVVEACPANAGCDAQLGRCVSCEPEGETRCSGPQLETCTGGVWKSLQPPCPSAQACLLYGAKCRTAACVQDDLRCDGATLSRCDAGGWVTEEQCLSESFCDAEGTGSCLVVCAPGTARCAAGRPEICHDDGSGWKARPYCPAPLVCRPRVDDPCFAPCEPSTLRCDGARLEECDRTGDAWIVSAVCLSPELCSCGVEETCEQLINRCGMPVCGGTLPDWRCEGSNLLQCAPGRDRWLLAGDCQREELCLTPARMSGYCAVCVPGKFGCRGSMLAHCGVDGRSYTGEDCEFGCDDEPEPHCRSAP